jgi:hypothetical protein
MKSVRPSAFSNERQAGGLDLNEMKGFEFLEEAEC